MWRQTAASGGTAAPEDVALECGVSRERRVREIMISENAVSEAASVRNAASGVNAASQVFGMRKGSGLFYGRPGALLYLLLDMSITMEVTGNFVDMLHQSERGWGVEEHASLGFTFIGGRECVYMYI